MTNDKNSDKESTLSEGFCKDRENDGQDDKDMAIEDIFSEIDGILTRLDGSDVPLDESFDLYKKGMELLKKCNDKLDFVEKQVLIINEEGNLDEFRRED
ncbi:MAG: exodeoxyribonuclease VII small subunit [Lachnospiraceae bacterium]|nr:exodeoxyribonuclease VII small subunit [Lachnospiraceae bacterium]